MTTTRNAQDLTGRNNNARKKEIAALRESVRVLTLDVTLLRQDGEHMRERIANLEVLSKSRP